MRIPDELKKSVVFILREDTPNTWTTFIGTGFLVSRKLTKIPGRSFVYLVTAKHVVVALKGKRFAIRVNKNGGGSELLVGDGTLRWYDHPNHEQIPADVSVFRMTIIRADHMDFRTIPIEMFLKKEEMEVDVGAGDEVFIVGLFANLSGKQRNSPLVRVGNIAMAPEDKVPTCSFGDIDAYLIEARSLGGISGSPVFTTPSGIVGKKRLYLMGLIHGHWDIPIALSEKIAPQDNSESGVDTSNPNYGVNMGIAIVTPAFKILETLEHPDLISQANAQEERMVAALPVKDE